MSVVWFERYVDQSCLCTLCTFDIHISICIYLYIYFTFLMYIYRNIYEIIE